MSQEPDAIGILLTRAFVAVVALVFTIAGFFVGFEDDTTRSVVHVIRDVFLITYFVILPESENQRILNGLGAAAYVFSLADFIVDMGDYDPLITSIVDVLSGVTILAFILYHYFKVRRP